MQKRILLLTGNPGAGKTTVLMKTIDMLKEKGYYVGGMISRETTEGGRRVGFEILDVSSGRRGWLAHIYQKNGPQVGKYRVNKEDLDCIGAKAITDAIKRCAVIAIDEIGPIELFSEKFKEATRRTIDSNKPIIAVVHWTAKDRLISETKHREDSEIVTITQENRNKLPEIISQKTLELL